MGRLLKAVLRRGPVGYLLERMKISIIMPQEIPPVFEVFNKVSRLRSYVKTNNIFHQPKFWQIYKILSGKILHSYPSSKSNFPPAYVSLAYGVYDSLINPGKSKIFKD